MSILNLIKPSLLEGKNYIPKDTGQSERLHANELPWCPIEYGSKPLNFYPDGEEEQMVQTQLSSVYGVASKNTLITRGSDEAIDIICRLFLDKGDAFMEFSPTFPMYAFYTRLQQGQLIQNKLDKTNDFKLNLEQVTQSWQPKCKIIMFCSPNNPTGQLVDLDLIAKTCEQYRGKSVIVVDEAYIEFSDSNSAISLLPQYDNLIIMRTLSKAYGLAGLRIGCIIANEELINACRLVIPPFTLSTVVLELASKALNNPAFYNDAHTRIKTQRSSLLKALQPFAFFDKIYPSEGNFILIESKQATALVDYLAQQNICVRSFSLDDSLGNFLRITVGDEAQNQSLIAALAAYNPGCIS